MGDDFQNHSKRLEFWTEEQARQMLNAALLYLASKEADGVLRISTAEMLAAVEKHPGGVAMALSDDDAVLAITAHGRLT